MLTLSAKGGVYEARVRKRVQDRNTRHIGDKLLAVEKVRGFAGADCHRSAELLLARLHYGVAGQQKERQGLPVKRLRD